MPFERFPSSKGMLEHTISQIFAGREVEAPAGFFGAEGRGASLARPLTNSRPALKNKMLPRVARGRGAE